jgi:choline kinase
MQKCLLAIDGEAILTRTVRLIHSAGIREVTVVTGHCAPLVREELERNFEVGESDVLRERVSLVHNPRFASTNTAYPLWLARFAYDDPALLVDGDVVFDEAALTSLRRAAVADGATGNVIAVARARGDDRPYVTVDALGRVSRVRRDVESSARSLQAAGLAILSRATLTDFFPALERRVITLERASDPYEAAFEDLLSAKRLSMHAFDLHRLPCIAIDRPEDLERARASFEDDPDDARTLQ